MVGIDGIKERIISMAGQEAEAILAEGREEASGLVAQAHKEASLILESAGKTSMKSNEDMMVREKSLAISESRKIYLAAKQDIIAHVLDQALEQLRNNFALKKKAYTQVLKKHIEGGETVSASTVDLPLLEEIQKETGLDYKIQKGMNKEINGGLIIKKDQIEINLSFEMIIAQNKPELVSTVASELF